MGIDFSGVSLPFDVSELLTTSMGLLKILGPFVLLAIAFPVVSKLMGSIKQTLASRGKGN